MTSSKLLRSLHLALPCLGALAACSLTVPAEDELFGDDTSAAANGGEAQAGSSGSSNASGAGALPVGGGDSGGTATAAAGSGAEGGGAEGGAAGGGAAGGEGEAGAGAGPIVLPPAALLLHYTFDDVTELVAEDVTGNGLDGTLAGQSLPTGAVGRVAGALQLDGAQKQYVQLPDGLLKDHEAVSIASWIKLAQAAAWDRLFDFNSGESNWFFFSPTGWNTNTSSFGTRCATRTTSVLAPEIMLTETVPINSWHHIAVVFAKPYLRYYLDGELKAQQENMSFSSDALGDTNQNWIGRSVYAADPYLSGLVDDFRIYTGALTAEEVAELADP